MAAQKGNKQTVKLKTPDEKAEAYRQYCEHLAQGWPKETFVSQNLPRNITYHAIEEYIKNYPEEFPKEQMRVAFARRYQHWLQEGITLMKGGYKFGSPQVWQTIMRNMFKDIGWDQEEVRRQEGPSEASVLVLAKMKELDAGNYNESKANPKLSSRNFET